MSTPVSRRARVSHLLGALSPRKRRGGDTAPYLRISLAVLAFGAVGLVAQHEAEQTIDDAWIGVGAADGDVRHNPHVAFANDLHELHDRVALRAE